MATHREYPVPDDVKARNDGRVRETEVEGSSPQPPLFPDEPDASGSHADSELFVHSRSPLVPSIHGLIVGPPRYKRGSDSPWARATRLALISAARAGHIALHAFRHASNFIVVRGNDLVRRVQHAAQARLRRVAGRNDRSRIVTRPGVRALGTVGAATLGTVVLVALVYIARPAPSANRIDSKRTSATNADASPVRRPTHDADAPQVPTGVTPVQTATYPSSSPTPDRATDRSRARVLPAAATKESRKAITPRAPARPIPDVPSIVGGLRITSQPEGAEVSLNGVLQGRTPLTISRLRPGSRVVSLFLPGYERWSWSVAVVADRQTPLAVRLQTDRR